MDTKSLGSLGQRADIDRLERVVERLLALGREPRSPTRSVPEKELIHSVVGPVKEEIRSVGDPPKHGPFQFRWRTGILDHEGQVGTI